MISHRDWRPTLTESDGNGGAEGQPSNANRVNCGNPKPNVGKGEGLPPSPFARSGMAIRSQAWPGFGGQEGSETSGASPNSNPRRRAPGLLDFDLDLFVIGIKEGEIVRASRKRGGDSNPLVAGSNPASRIACSFFFASFSV